MVHLTIENEHRATIQIGSDIAAETVEDLRVSLDEAMNKGCLFVELDMSNVHYINSSGLGLLIGAHSKLKGLHGKLQLRHIGENLLNLIEDMNLTKEFFIDTQ